MSLTQWIGVGLGLLVIALGLYASRRHDFGRVWLDESIRDPQDPHRETQRLQALTHVEPVSGDVVPFRRVQ